MQRIQLEENEEITRKEYFKRKKIQSKKIKKRSKLTIAMLITIVILVTYIAIQIYVYNRKNNFSYLADESVLSQDIYNVYYVTEGYTYDPKYSLNTIYSNGFNDITLLTDAGFSDIQVSKDKIVGIREKKLFSFEKTTSEIKNILDKEVYKYTLYGDECYLILEENKKLAKFNLTNLEYVEFTPENICEIVVDAKNIFIVKDEKTKKQLYKLEKDGNNIVKMANDANVSYIICDEERLYFVNKSDDNKIYSINKDGSDYKRVADIKSVTDTGVLKDIDGSKYMYINNRCLFYINSGDENSLWKYDLDTGENVKEISMQVEILQNVGSTVFYKIKNSVGVYLYNTETKFMSEITKRKVKEFIVDTYTKVFIDKENKFIRNYYGGN